MKDKDYNPIKLAQKWKDELACAEKEDESWVRSGKKIVKRYRDKRGETSTAKKYNILWSNIQTLLPAIYGKMPQPEVARTHKDQDPVGRTAAQILERALQYELANYADYDRGVRGAVMDLLLPGRGTCWVRFENREIKKFDGTVINQAAAVVDLVYWEDFRHSTARNWEEVTWVARRVYMSKAEVVKRFGEEFEKISLTHIPVGVEDKIKNGEDCDHLKKAKVWEIWDKESGKVCWVAEGEQKALDCIDDPYGLDCFWPCPRPLFATQTTDTVVPVPDFALYQDQAEEIDMLTQRIALLLKALKIVGVYDASQAGVQRMLSETMENVLIPVDTWAAFSEKGGIKGVVDFLPLDMVINSLRTCYEAREQAKQVIYEITGLSDIIRGASVASESATAQQIKSNFASLRLKDRQREVALFASELLRIKAQLMADLYPPDQIVEMSGIMGTQDAQFVEPALQLIKSEPLRNFRIEVAADSLVEIDESQEKASRLEFLQAAGSFLQQVLPVAQQVPELSPMLGEMLMYGVRSFKSGRTMEAAFESAMAQLAAPKPEQPPQPDPEQIKMQAQVQIEQTRTQSAAQIESGKAQIQLQLQEMKQQHEKELEAMKQQAETERQRYTVDVDAQVRLQIAALTAVKEPETPDYTDD